MRVAMSPDASRRIADVTCMIERQAIVKQDLAMRGLPIGPTENLIEIMRACLQVIEKSQQPDAMSSAAAECERAA